jgi:DMSO/TMAO reductase YedYZ molybdopterin-dependent catalytic subunit
MVRPPHENVNEPGTDDALPKPTPEPRPGPTPKPRPSPATRLARACMAVTNHTRHTMVHGIRSVARWLNEPLPAPPERFRRGPFRDGAFSSTLRSQRLTSQLGIVLGAAFLICFATGYLSHAIQHPPPWFWWPARPVWLYRVTQGVHVATGLALIPLLLAKLWSVYPRLFAWPPARDAAHALERGSIAVLVASALFQVTTGVLNIARWYGPMPFFFTTAHYWNAWLAIGALLVHIGVQLPVIRRSLSRSAREITADEPRRRGELSRRGVLGAVAATAGVLTLATVGQTVPWLANVSVLAPRRPTTGPQRLPVNKSAAAAGVMQAATNPAYRLVVIGPRRTMRLSLADLAAMPQHRVTLPITCVEGWSASAVWIGVRLADLIAAVGGDESAQAMAESLQAGGRYRASVVAPPHAHDPLTLVATHLMDEPLALDHGYPCRLIAPNRPGVMQTKWLAAVTVVNR